MDEFVRSTSVLNDDVNSHTSADTVDGVVSNKARKVYKTIRAETIRRGLSRAGLGLFLIVVSALTILMITFRISYSVTANGVDIGNVAEEEDLDVIIASAEETVSQILGYEYTFSDVSTSAIVTRRSEHIDTRAVEKTLIDSVDEIVKCYYLEVDGTPIFRADSYDRVSDMVNSLESQYLNDPACVSVDFEENIIINYGYVPTETSVHFTTSLRELRSMVTARSSYQIQYTEAIPYETEEYYTDTLYEREARITQEGVDGEETFTALETYVDGELVDTEILYSEITLEPITERIARGTKERPTAISYGSYIWPLNGGVVTSTFGYRDIEIGSSYHKGVDIGAAYGTDIYAADGGTVIYSGWMDGFGYIVCVQHDTGEVTYYAHCSTLYVGYGERVFRGQTIAAVGSTGVSSGPHLHFEIRVGGMCGISVDPLLYI